MSRICRPRQHRAGQGLADLMRMILVGYALAATARASTAQALSLPRPALIKVTSVRGGARPVQPWGAKVPSAPPTSTAAVAASASEEGASSVGGGTATIPNEVFNLVKSIIGAGVLSLPYGVAVFGNAPSALIPAVALIALMGALSAWTFGLIGRICQRTQTQSYAEAWDRTVGKSTSWLIAFSCFFDCAAGNLSYSMILADSIANLSKAAGFALTRNQSLFTMTGLVLLPLCMLKNLSSLAPFSLVGIMGMLYTTVAMGLRYFGRFYQPGGLYHATQLTPPVFGSAGAAAALSPKALILACMLSNAYIAHFNSPKFLNELKNNTMSRFYQVIAWSFGTAVALFALITSFGFLTFGAASNGLILNNYATTDVLASLSRIAVVLSITFSYPLIFVGTVDGLLDLFKVPVAQQREDRLRTPVTLATLAVITLLASRLTDLGLVASVGGATFGTALVFVYPAIMFLKSQTKRTAETWPVAGIGILGVIMGAIGTYLSFQGA